MLGLARDNPERLRDAARYLEHPPAQALMPGRTAKEQANRTTWNRVTRARVVA
jgi:hypothetical protein